MGGIQRAGTGKNKKVTEISPLLAFWPEGLGVKFLLKFITLVRNELFYNIFHNNTTTSLISARLPDCVIPNHRCQN